MVLTAVVTKIPAPAQPLSEASMSQPSTCTAPDVVM